MKTLLAILLTGAFLIATPVANAKDVAPLLQKAGCIACHSTDKKILGPSFKEVSAKYKGKSMETAMIKKVRDGGSGAWGPMPMPSNEGKLTDDEFKSVVEWILSL
ncbi:cytochrome c6 [Methylophilaceae bacterium]|nr:cytochrome c6 [Methylophilaceae bacterium]